MHPVPSPMTRPSTKPDDLGTSHIPPSDSFVGKLDFGASLRFSFVTTCRFARPPVGADQVFTQPTRTFTSGLPTDWSPAPPPDITTVATGQVPLTGLSPARTPTSIAATGFTVFLSVGHLGKRRWVTSEKRRSALLSPGIATVTRYLGPSFVSCSVDISVSRPRVWLLRSLPHGKPIVAATDRIPTLRFNLSHSHQFALFAFCLDHEIGIDIEKIRPKVALEGIETRYFSPKERAELEALPRIFARRGSFFAGPRKEAYVKARGEGLNVPLGGFSVSLTPGKPAVLHSSDEERWSLYSLDPATGFVGALVAEGRGHRLAVLRTGASSDG